MWDTELYPRGDQADPSQDLREWHRWLWAIRNWGKRRTTFHRAFPTQRQRHNSAWDSCCILLSWIVLVCIGVYWPYGVSRKCAVGKLKPNWHTHTHTQMYIQYLWIHYLPIQAIRLDQIPTLPTIFHIPPLKPRSQLAENALSCFFCSGCNCKNTNVSLDFSNLVLESHQDFQKWHTKHASTLEILMSV